MVAKQKQVEAFILVETKAGKTLEVAARLKKVTGILSVYAVTGPYDIVVHAAAKDLKALAATVVDRIGASPGVEHTLTCIVVANSGNPAAK
ncbi:MAG: Lrp/AsnC family transcriptional regulator [Armatimonadetes bacterium]|nr:Lrp/AsnC family transcriptional regulator [candidate division Zixibacteria bacterium]NIO75383.1 Lrp/AsnC family transcriptional regulator [Armatimonadota bacterium]